MNEPRNFLFDNTKALLIFSVVIAHYFRASPSFAVPSIGGVIYIISFSYIMQGFLFVSGYFSRNPDKCRSSAFQVFFFPYLLWMPIMFCLRYVIFGRAHFDITLPTMALWYLLTLFVYRFILKDLIKIKFILPISIAVSLTAGFIPFLDSTLSIGRTFSFLPFFLLGYYFKREWIERLRDIPKSVSWFLLLALIGFTVFLAYNRVFPLSALYMKASYASTGLDYGQGIALRIAISVISLTWLFVFINLVPKGRTVLTVVGQNTMPVYILHIIVRYIIKGFGDSLEQDILSYMILISAAVLSVWLFSRPFIADKYDRFINNIYTWVIRIPAALIRKI